MSRALSTRCFRRAFASLIILALVCAGPSLHLSLDQFASSEHQLSEGSSSSWLTSLPPGKSFERNEKTACLADVVPDSYEQPGLLGQRDQLIAGVPPSSASLIVTLVTSSSF